MSDAPNDLGHALRTWRDRLPPADAGLSGGKRRRAPGLRREELADLAGVSVDYIVRLEQGRAQHPSSQVIGALARALQLSTEERDLLYRAAGLLPPHASHISSHVPPGVQRILTRLGDIPLAVFTADLYLVEWTPLWEALIGDPLLVAPDERNLVHATFLSDPRGETPFHRPVRSHRGNDAMEASLVSDLRTAASTYPDDQRLRALIRRAIDASPRFAELWTSGAVGSHTTDRKTIANPHVGEITLDCDILTVPGADLKLVVYTAASDSPDAEKLEFLRVVGAHAFPPSGQTR